MEKIIQECAKAILSSVEWSAGEEQGKYVEADAFGEWNKEGWEDTSPLIGFTGDEERRIREMRPTIEELMERGSDEWTDELGDDEAEGNRGRHKSASSGPETWLGRYFAMAPRGKIELHQQRLAAFFWKLILVLRRNHRITAWQLARLAEATVAKTFRHEQFHHFIDVSMVLLGTRQFKRRLLEEALAVAYSQREVERNGGSWPYWENQRGQAHVPQALRDAFLAEAFNYTAPGYRDWRKYQGWKCMEAAQEYVIHPNARRLLEIASGARPWHHHPRWHMWFDMMMDRYDDDLVDVVLV